MSYLPQQEDHQCWMCRHFNQFNYDRETCRTFGMVMAGIFNNCDAFDLDKDYDNWFFEFNYYRDNPDREEAWIANCKRFEKLPIDYNWYIHSGKWLKLRNQRLKMDKFQCQLCGTGKNLRVHHITYDNLGFESMDDLITLCNDCHAKVHENDLKNKGEAEVEE